MTRKETDDFSYQDLADEACPLLRDDFIRFVNTGEACEEYLVHIDYCEKCQSAIEKAFERMSAALEGITDCLKFDTD